MRDSIYPFATLTRPGKTITMPVGKRGQPTEHQLRSAAWAYGSRNGFRVRTQWYDSRKTAIVITRIRGRK
jgi:hypothetical protein